MEYKDSYFSVIAERAKRRFESKTNRDRADGCWEWTGTRNSNNYGVFSLGDITINASRAAWFIYRGGIPDGMEVCHRCDRGWCVNPDHLFLGTHAENMADSRKKGRSPGPAAGINLEELRTMIENGKRQIDAARHFGVSSTAIQFAMRTLGIYRPVPRKRKPSTACSNRVNAAPCV